ncbi:hypothetical protein GWI33_006861 [Rhynchophorus ferrugineus]|uniref:Uncharacterized protein n=1 Tax=Rhynchophorus ferrugineus TaxID=354439 RepID=A0A834MCL3_RHYFE|nr:hypothetical protein GWI33_006861 [Rhynchophorus ferrugineus]
MGADDFYSPLSSTRDDQNKMNESRSSVFTAGSPGRANMSRTDVCGAWVPTAFVVDTPRSARVLNLTNMAYGEVTDLLITGNFSINNIDLIFFYINKMKSNNLYFDLYYFA